MGCRLGVPFTQYHFGYEPEHQAVLLRPGKGQKASGRGGVCPKDLISFLHSPNGRYLNDKEVAEAVVGDLRKVGINASVKINEWGTHINMLYAFKGDPAYILGWGGATFDADATFFPLLRTNQVLSHYSNPKLGCHHRQARSIMDKEKRQKIYRRHSNFSRKKCPGGSAISRWIFTGSAKGWTGNRGQMKS